jgi:hypothetical protein
MLQMNGVEADLGRQSKRHILRTRRTLDQQFREVQARWRALGNLF